MVTGIITEYNPFHKGHQHQLNCLAEIAAAKQTASQIVVCMSGSITQRGELSCLDKWQRAEAAVASGVNLVIELPTVFACSSAQHFALGGVQLLDRLGIVDQLAFGTPYPEIETLQQAAEIQLQLEDKASPLHHRLASLLQQGQSYGAAISHVLVEETGLAEEFLQEPNTILALEYLSSLKRLQSKIKPVAIKREGPQHKDRDTIAHMASGQKIRQLLSQGDIQQAAALVPPAMAKTFQALATGQTSAQPQSILPDTARLQQLILWQLLTQNGPQLAEIYGFNEGLEYKFLSQLHQPDYAHLVSALATRRYPATRIQRTLCYLLLQLKATHMADFQAAGPQYIRVLAFDDTGRQLLHQIKAKSQLPIITRAAEHLNRRTLQQQSPAELSLLQQMLWYDIASTNLRQLCCNSQLNPDLTTTLCYIS